MLAISKTYVPALIAIVIEIQTGLELLATYMWDPVICYEHPDALALMQLIVIFVLQMLIGMIIDDAFVMIILLVIFVQSIAVIVMKDASIVMGLLINSVTSVSPMLI